MPFSSSSPSGSRDGFGAFLGRSLALLERELPEAYARLCAAVAPRELVVIVDGEPVALGFTPTGARRLPAPPAAPAVRLATTRGAILDLIDGRATLVEAVLADRVVLRGAPADLAAFHDGLLAYLQGAVRSPSFPGLLREYRAPFNPSTDPSTDSSKEPVHEGKEVVDR